MWPPSSSRVAVHVDPHCASNDAFGVPGRRRIRSILPAAQDGFQGLEPLLVRARSYFKEIVTPSWLRRPIRRISDTSPAVAEAGTRTFAWNTPAIWPAAEPT